MAWFNGAVQTLANPQPFRSENFTIVPNPVLNLVLSGKLKHRDLLTYAYLLGRHEAMRSLGKGDYAAAKEEDMATYLGCSGRTLRSSIKRLLDTDIIERKDTGGNTRTRVLVTVSDGQVVSGPRLYPVPNLKPPECVESDSDAFDESAIW